jgi:hypothetical protein
MFLTVTYENPEGSNLCFTLLKLHKTDPLREGDVLVLCFSVELPDFLRNCY